METIDQLQVRDRRRLWISVGLGLLAAVLALAAITARSEAAFPGEPGKISFDSTRDGNTEIYVMNADGSEQTRLTNELAIDRDAAFSPDGRRIAFVSERTGNSEVWVMNADGSQPTQLTTNTAADFQPAFSPDGQRIAFMSDRGLQGDMEIYVMDADGSGETRLTNNVSFEGQPTFSPDGQRIAFASDREGNFEIHTMNADGSNPARLTNSAASESRPNFSPDGQRIAFRTDRDGNGEVYVMNADGTAESRLTDNPALDGEPAFSPDGQRIAFRSHRDGQAEIYVMNADGSGQTNLTNDPNTARRPDWQSTPSPNATPTAAFTASCSAGSCTFDASGSADSDGTITNYSWAFGDGTSGSDQVAEHTYARAGTYTVTLTVTDDGGDTATYSKSITAISLTARVRVKGVAKVDLSWNGPSGASFVVSRNGTRIATVSATAYTDALGKRASGSYTYQVCVAAGTSCSNQVTVTL
jgi:dipeptidyl aminopeptidase/acylaminoacyl peptidase